MDGVDGGLTRWGAADSEFPLKSILEVLSAGATFLERKGVESARLSMEHLLAHALGLQRMDLYRQFDRPLSEAELAPVRALTARRAAGEPLQHLLGTVDFFRYCFGCDERALIPRPETEELVEKVLARRLSSPPGRILDMGCGSGVIGLSLAAGFPEARVVLADASAEALALARENAERVAAQWMEEALVPAYVPLGEVARASVAARVAESPGTETEPAVAVQPPGLSASAFLDRLSFVQSDLFAALDGGGEGSRFDVMVANLPYIPRVEVATLSREVQRDPMLALIGGETGLELIERFIAGAGRFASPGCLVALEHGPDQGDAIDGCLSAAGFTAIALESDMSRRPRFTFAVAPPA